MEITVRRLPLLIINMCIMDKGYFDINFDIVSKLKLPKGVLKVYFDINLDIVSKLMDMFMVIVSMKKIKVIL